MTETPHTAPHVHRWSPTCAVIKAVWRFLINPNAHLPLLLLVAGGLVLGAAGVGGTVIALHLTSTNEFCTSCHAQNAAVEWQQSPHYANSVGFVAGCADCHESRSFIPQMVRKVEAANEVWNQLLGTISTPEKYEANRLRMAQKEWARLHADNSQECRNCHEPASMVDADKPGIRDMHKAFLTAGQTCIDCHKGVAHRAPNE